MKRFIALALALVMLAFAICSCGNVNSESTSGTTASSSGGEASQHQPRGDLLTDYTAQIVSGTETDEKFISAMLDFSAELMKNTVSDKKDNSLISPLSVMIALAMTSNGAENETKAQFEKVFGVTVDEINKYLYYYVNSLSQDEDAKVKIANSIWFSTDGGIDFSKDFLQKNKDYYDPQMYEKDFSDGKTVDEINDWVKKYTDDMIEKIIDELSPDTVAVLMNALALDAKWSKQYEDYQCRTEDFHSYGGETEQVKMMRSDEEVYLSGKDFTGFEKRYVSGYKFVALLPSEDVDVFDFVNSLSGERLADIFASKEYGVVHATVPEFEYDFDVDLEEPLSNMGLTDAFDAMKADFSGMGDGGEELYIGQALHKTHIEVTQAGTRAAAVTYIAMDEKSVIIADPKTVTLDRPFVYLIVDGQSNIPLFAGIVTSVGK